MPCFFPLALALVAQSGGPSVEEAIAAFKAKDYAVAARHFEALAEPKPRPAAIYRGLAIALGGDAPKGKAIIEAGRARPPELIDALMVANELHRHGQPHLFGGHYRDEAHRLCEAALQADAKDLGALLALAMLSRADGDIETLSRASEALVRHHPLNTQSHYTRAVYLAEVGRDDEADASIRRAGELGLEPTVVQGFLDRRSSDIAVVAFSLLVGVVFALWLFGLLMMFVAGRILSSITVRSIGRGDLQLQGAIRRAYALLINLAGLYYYLSWPVVILLSFAVPIVLFLILLLMPIVTTSMLVGAALFALISVLSAVIGVVGLFVRVDDGPYGRILIEADAPELWQLCRDVAERVDTRPIDQIWLTQDSECAVLERGSGWARWRDRAQRVLVIGRGAIGGLDVPAFSAILAHEYGHFIHRDTAGGSVALRVNTAMQRTAEAMAPTWWNVTYHFLRAYHFLFRRISHGACRLQEVQADRVAFTTYGPSAFVRGLTFLIRKSVEQEARMKKAIERRLQTGRPTDALFREPPLLSPEETAGVEFAIKAELFRPTTLDDTHPSPTDRFDEAARFDDPWDLNPDDRTVDSMFVGLDAIDDGLAAESLERGEATIAEIRKANLNALAYYTDLIATADSGASRMCRARIRLQSGDVEEAEIDLERAAALDDWRVDALIELGRIYEARQEPRRAIAALEKVLARKPDERHRAVLLSLGRCYLACEEPEQAVARFSQVIESGPTHLDAHFGRAQALVQMGHPDAARPDFAKVVEEAPSFSPAQEALDTIGQADSADRTT